MTTTQPGPWMVHKMSKPQGGGLDWYVTRDVKHSEPIEWADVERLRDSNGAAAKFASEADARAAIRADAAPDLQAACEYMLANAFEHKWHGDERGFNLLRAAIAKASPL